MENKETDCCVCLPLLIPNDLDGYHLVGLVIQTFQDLAERSFPNHLQDFISVAYMVMQDLRRVFRESHLTSKSA